LGIPEGSNVQGLLGVVVREWKQSFRIQGDWVFGYKRQREVRLLRLAREWLGFGLGGRMTPALKFEPGLLTREQGTPLPLWG